MSDSRWNNLYTHSWIREKLPEISLAGKKLHDLLAKFDEFFNDIDINTIDYDSKPSGANAKILLNSLRARAEIGLTAIVTKINSNLARIAPIVKLHITKEEAESLAKEKVRQTADDKAGKLTEWEQCRRKLIAEDEAAENELGNAITGAFAIQKIAGDLITSVYDELNLLSTVLMVLCCHLESVPQGLALQELLMSLDGFALPTDTSQRILRQLLHKETTRLLSALINAYPAENEEKSAAPIDENGRNTLVATTYASLKLKWDLYAIIADALDDGLDSASREAAIKAMNHHKSTQEDTLSTLLKQLRQWFSLVDQEEVIQRHARARTEQRLSSSTGLILQSQQPSACLTVLRWLITDLETPRQEEKREISLAIDSSLSESSDSETLLDSPREEKRHHNSVELLASRSVIPETSAIEQSKSIIYDSLINLRRSEEDIKPLASRSSQSKLAPFWQQTDTTEKKSSILNHIAQNLCFCSSRRVK